MSINTEKMTAEIDLMNNKNMYGVKDGQLIKHDQGLFGVAMEGLMYAKGLLEERNYKINKRITIMQNTILCIIHAM